MPGSGNNSLGSLGIVDGRVDQNFLLKLNDRLRRISQILPGGSTVTNTASGSSSGGQLILSVPGMLAVQSNVAPAITFGAATTFSTAVILVKIASIGSSITAQLFVSGTAYGPVLTLAAAATSASFPLNAGAIPANALLRLDITGVGALLTGVSFPGSDLTVILR